jgi:hypothetical protein
MMLLRLVERIAVAMLVNGDGSWRWPGRAEEPT